MLILTAKVDKKKILMVLVAAAVLIAGLLMLLGGDHEDSTPTVAPSLNTNEGRVKFLTDFGWEVATSPVESSQVRIPEKADEVFSRYNALQKSQGYDLADYAGQTVMRYVYKVNNYPGATEPVYATVLISKNQVIGGDVTDTAARGVIQGFRKTESTTEPSQAENAETTETTQPTEPTAR